MLLNLELASLRPMQESDLATVLTWRNHEDIRRWMLNSEPIDLNAHIEWFNRNKNNKNKHFLIFEYDKEPQGYVSFVAISNSSVYEWGFYVQPQSIQGMGRILGECSLNYAFEYLNIKKVFGQVLGFNTKSLNFHQKLGFVQEGKLRKHFKDDRGESDIYQFGLFNTEWLEFKNEQNNSN